MFCNYCKTKIPLVDGIPRFYETTRKNIIDFDEINIKNSTKWTGWRRKNYEFFQKNLENIKKSYEVLDIGAGTAPFSALFEPFTTFKVDFEPYRGIDFLTDLNKPFPIADNSFDIIIMSNLLEHIPEPLLLLKECHRILKQEGKLIMTVPFLIKVHQAPYDFLRYTEFMLERLLGLSGFQEIKIEKIGNIFDVYAQVFSSLYMLCYKDSSTHKLKRKLMELFRRFHNLFIKVFLKISNCDVRNKEDAIGYPHGYGCAAVRRD